MDSEAYWAKRSEEREAAWHVACAVAYLAVVVHHVEAVDPGSARVG